MNKCVSMAGLLALTFAAFHSSEVQAQQQPDVRAAQYLAANCANCHGTHGLAVGAMPSLAGQPKATIVEQMRAFRDGKRPATIMHQIAKGYTDQQVELIAEHFARQPAAR